MPPSIERAESTLQIEGNELRPRKTVYSNEEILITAPIEHCFGIISNQLEKPCQWDSILFEALPISDIRRQIGATSRVTVNLGGRKVDSQAIISHYRPYRGITWITTGRPKLREAWRLEMKPGSTLVQVSLSFELNRWILERFIYKITGWKRVQEDINQTLYKLKETAENAVCG